MDMVEGNNVDHFPSPIVLWIVIVWEWDPNWTKKTDFQLMLKVLTFIQIFG